MTTRSHISITADQGQPALSAPQKKFNKLVQSIDTQRKLLAAWQASAEVFEQRYVREFGPMVLRLNEANAELVRFLDASYAQKGLTKTDRKKLAALIADMAYALMDGPRLEAMKEIYNRYSDTDFDTEARLAAQRVKDAVAGYDTAFDDAAEAQSPEAFMRMLHERMAAEQAEYERMHEKIAEEKAAHRSQHRKKTARELKQEAAEKDASQSLREVFRKLASALHPDRETDPAERLRKTALMQRVNQAYASKNLLDMLQLQIEAEQIDPAHINNLSTERLRHYNQVLSDQLRELQQELRDVEDDFKARYGMNPHERTTPSNMLGRLREQVNMLLDDIHGIQEEQRALEDVKTLKLWIKLETSRSAEFDEMNGVFD